MREILQLPSQKPFLHVRLSVLLVKIHPLPNASPHFPPFLLTQLLFCTFKTSLFYHFPRLVTDLPLSPSPAFNGVTVWCWMWVFQSRDVRSEGEVVTEVEVEAGAEVTVLVGLQRGAAALTGPPVAVCGK